MKSFCILIFIIVFVLKLVIAQDVDIPANLLPPPKTTPKPEIDTEYDDETSTDLNTFPDSDNLIKNDTEVIETTTIENNDDTEKGSWNNKKNPPISDNLVDAPLYTYPQINPPSFISPCNNINTQLPVIVPPIYNPITDEPELEELKSCPIGFVLNNSQCVPQYSITCPSGYTWKDDRCVLSQIVCPVNFDYDGTKCIERKICPPNHIWKDEKCQMPEPTCPTGFRWNGEKCVVTTIQCQPGSVLINNECVIESVTCPPGYNLINGQCIEPPKICPPGYEFQSSGFCTQINKKCPNGSVLINGHCQKIEVICPPGTQKIGDQCYQIQTLPPPIITTTIMPTLSPYPPITVTQQPPSSTEQSPTTVEPPILNQICPDSFIFYNGQCYRCPEGFSLCNGMCLRNIAQCGPSYPQPIPIPSPNYPHFPNYPNFPPNINVNINFTNPFPPPSSPWKEKPYTIINNIEPINNTIHNINNITHPVTLNNVNENNIYVYTDTQCADGSIRTTIIKNNETIIGCTDVENKHNDEETVSKSPHMPENDNDNDEEKCCEVVTPRQCKKRFTDQWICTHRRYKYCGKFCIADRLYLKPPATTWKNSILTIQPSPNPSWLTPCYGKDCPPVDCTGCTNGSFNCSPQCYTYPCASSTCTFVDQEDFCGNVNGGEMCSK
ncbi:hypothetical protein PVAND_011262 [Polypedilum vanderplanki]|uniref:Uncharacterized protein n=1 Tax=Polypedilum vanderplanki TaxID=319348 RepID=A0A9J6CJ05_POLVA|nr:hypothetical protein PVAND_011262 [Polypedilum vanderplanki]